MGVSQGRPAGQAACFTQGICGSAIFAGQARQLFGQCIRSLEGRDRAVNHLPGFFIELHALDVLSEIVQPPQQVERIPQRGKGSMTQACRHTQPGLLPQLHQNPILDGLKINRQRCMTAGLGTHAGRNLDRYLILFPQYLGVHVAAVEFRH